MSSPSYLFCRSIFHRSSKYFISKSSTSFKSFSSRLCHRDVRRTSTAAASPPWLMLPPAFEGGGDMIHNFYSLTENKVITLNGSGEKELTDVLSKSNLHCAFKGSSHGYLALFNEVSFDLFLYNPISHRHIKLPPIHNLPYFTNFNNSLTKVFLSCSPDENCCALMTYSVSPYFKAAFCYPGRSNEWTPFPFGCTHFLYDECAYSSEQQLLFALRSDRYLETWDLHYLEPKDVEKMLNNGHFMPVEHLVVVNKHLLLVTRYVVHVDPDGSSVDCLDGSANNLPHMTVYFCAHKYDHEKGDFVYMEDSLDGLALFVGNQSDNVALPAANFPGLKPDSIYFTDTIGMRYWKLFHPGCGDYDAPFGGHDIGIFNYEDKTVSSCYYPCDVQSIQRIFPSPMWFFTSSSI
ncbi:hypothetical protein CASFOL_033091 [Castilleja foliolosa]|uniref:KIB1-4 beta-propeller domain-containing protein n=1 Tax=Castilleja foliolosa TaxID=1961234 RepID=A0ABD3C3D3_9LAMI